MAPWSLRRLRLGWREGWERIGLPAPQPNTRAVPLRQAREQEAAPRRGRGLMGWRGVLGSSCAVGPMPPLTDCFVFIMPQPALSCRGGRGELPDAQWWQRPGSPRWRVSTRLLIKALRRSR